MPGRLIEVASFHLRPSGHIGNILDGFILFSGSWNSGNGGKVLFRNKLSMGL
jgi:hypothetical protein